MPDSKKYLRPEVLQRIARLELRARHVVDGFLSGMHRSPYLGQSVEFLQHRPYVPGDDLRHVDWKVWARQDRLYLKQFEEDTNLRCTLLLDGSRSMRYRSNGMDKWEYASTIAASLAFLVLRQQDAVGCVVFDEMVRATVPLRSKHSHLASVIEALDAARPERKTDLEGVLRQTAHSIPPKGMVVLISDLLADRQGTLKGLKLLRQRGHDVLVFHVLDPDELDFPFQGPVRFEGLENATHVTCNPRALRQEYLAALGTYLEELRRGCAHQAVDYALLRTNQPLDAALSAFLHSRLGMHHRN